MNKHFILTTVFFTLASTAGATSPGHICTFRNNHAEEITEVINPDHLSKDISPRDDFFGYVNANWLANNPIPDSKGGWGAFNELDENSLQTLHKVLQSMSDNKLMPVQGSNRQILNDYYASGMDSIMANNQGIKPVQHLLTGVALMNDKLTLTQLMADFGLKGIKQPLDFYAYGDQKDATKNIFYINQSGLGLPDRDYYFRTDERSQQIREAYKKYIVDLLIISGKSEGEATKMAKQIYGLEEKLAGAMLTLVERRDPYTTYNKVSAKELKSLAPNIDWGLFFNTIGIPVQQEVVVESPHFLKVLDSLVRKAPLEQWKSYNYFHVMNTNAGYLGDALANLRFDFYGKQLSGRLVPEERWKRIIRSTDELLGDLLGQEYVKAAFTPQAKAKVLEMVNNLSTALKERITALSWMSEETKIQALEKLAAIDVKIGYPDKWKSYEGLQIKKQPFAINRMSANVYELKRNLSRLGKPVDRTEWLITPQTVNAYYNASLNEIVFPAAILQPPFFSEKADEASNYGGIGMIIGHELTHGFDDEGCQYDAKGNLNNWWQSEDADRYKAMAQKFVDQYNGYSPIEGVNINGELTLGENIADLGGLVIAYEGFKKAAPNATNMDGFSPDERFFISFAQAWRGHLRTETQRTYLYTDPHSPEFFRVKGALTNFAPFYDTYHLQPGDNMYTPVESRSEMW